MRRESKSRSAMYCFFIVNDFMLIKHLSIFYMIPLVNIDAAQNLLGLAVTTTPLIRSGTSSNSA